MTIAKYVYAGYCLLLLCSCAVQQKIVTIAEKDLFSDPVMAKAHTGISIYDPQTGKYIYDYQGDKYFVPASNIKIITCYTAMKYLKHILPGIRYYENDTAIYLLPTGDPSFLHRDFKQQPVISFLQKQQKSIYITQRNWKDKPLGPGWSWDDYNGYYMTERNALPVYGNTIKWIQEKVTGGQNGADSSISVYSDPEINWKVRFDAGSVTHFDVTRDRDDNIFHIGESNERYREIETPFVVKGIASALELLADTIGKEIHIAEKFSVSSPEPKVIWSQPVDSLLKPMMYRSDNFFAEQLLLMASEQRFGTMNGEQIIDSVLKNDFAGLPQPPVWVDGSGMSRYNLFSPRDMVFILDKMNREFGMDRIRDIFPTGGTGTLKGYYTGGSGYIYAKTGSMSGVVALSGYLYTNKKRLLIFSAMVNNNNGSSGSVKRAVERFITEVREKY
ncbi:MAG: D-alanyl-D-alanine carboxypeptidase/D-alanyl-D-alanine-endopeptidase [Flavitalea sp.]